MASSADKPRSDYEERSRVFCHLPFNPPSNEHRVILDFVEYLDALRAKNVNLKGYTKTVEFPPVMEGLWRDSTRKQFLKEGIVLFIIDFERTIRDKQLWEMIADIKHSSRNEIFFTLANHRMKFGLLRISFFV